MVDFPKKTLADWTALATKDTGGASPDSLVWDTPEGIPVNAIAPGAIRTPRQMKLWHTPEEEAKILAQQCLKQRVDPIHVTAMVLFLASADAAMCTAHNYWVDGGYR